MYLIVLQIPFYYMEMATEREKKNRGPFAWSITPQRQILNLASLVKNLYGQNIWNYKDLLQVNARIYAVFKETVHLTNNIKSWEAAI